MIKKIFAVILAAALIFSMSSCANYRTAVDQQAVHESGGPFTNPKLEDCKPPGDKGRDSWVGETFRYYPSGDRNWTFKAGGDTEPFKVFVKTPAREDDDEARQAIAITIPGEATMRLTQNCDLLKKFDTNFGRKYTAYTTETDEQPGAGWDNLLSDKFDPALQNGLNLALQSTTYDRLVSDPDLRQELQDDVAEATLASLNRSLGDDYFTDVQVTIFQPVLPESIQTNIEANEAAKQFNEKVETEKKTMKELVDILGPYGYLVYKGMQDGQVPVLPVPQGSGVSLPNTR